MNAQRLLGYLLLAFAIGSVAVFLGRDATSHRSIASSAGSPPPNEADIPPRAKLVVYYFDEGKDCATCLSIPEYTKAALDGHFAAEVASGDILWRSVDVEKPENAHFITAYKLYTKSVVLVRVDNGAQVRWQNLDTIWDLVYDKDAFVEYVRKKIREELDTPP